MFHKRINSVYAGALAGLVFFCLAEILIGSVGVSVQETSWIIFALAIGMSCGFATVDPTRGNGLGFGAALLLASFGFGLAFYRVFGINWMMSLVLMGGACAGVMAGIYKIRNRIANRRDAEMMKITLNRLDPKTW